MLHVFICTCNGTTVIMTCLILTKKRGCVDWMPCSHYHTCSINRLRGIVIDIDPDAKFLTYSPSLTSPPNSFQWSLPHCSNMYKKWFSSYVQKPNQRLRQRLFNDNWSKQIKPSQIVIFLQAIPYIHLPTAIVLLHEFTSVPYHCNL